jgi:hypothetical protein
VALAMLGIFLTAYPTFAFVVGGTLALVIVIAMRERWRGRPF